MCIRDSHEGLVWEYRFLNLQHSRQAEALRLLPKRALAPVSLSLIHIYFNPSNIIVTDNGTPYILDWSHATQGNASADVARTYLLFCLDGKEELADKYLDLFCKKSDTAKQYVQKWMPVVAASQSVKGKPEEKEFLDRWVNVVEYE